jgi:hypothetical protein
MRTADFRPGSDQALAGFLLIIVLGSSLGRAQASAGAAALPGAVDNESSSGESLTAAANEGGSGEPPYRLKRAMNEYGLWGAASVDSKTPLGNTAYRRTWMAGLRYGRLVGVKKGVSFEYTLDLIPVEVVFNSQESRILHEGKRSSATVYGMGLCPGGLKLSFAPRSRFKPFLGMSGGLVIYAEALPLDGRKLNFWVSLDGGVQIFTRPKRAIILGYKYHHVSNAFTAPVNIGTNVNMLTVGYSLFK